ELRGVPLVQLTEALVASRQVLLELLVALQSGERLLLGTGDLALDRVDLLEESAILALGAHPIDLLLVFLELLLGVGGRRLGGAALAGGLLDRVLELFDLGPAQRVLVV